MKIYSYVIKVPAKDHDEADSILGRLTSRATWECMCAVEEFPPRQAPVVDDDDDG